MNAGVWPIGLTRTGNELGLTLAKQSSLDPADLTECLERIRQRFAQAGAHYVVESIAIVLAVLDEIAAAVRWGEQP